MKKQILVLSLLFLVAYTPKGEGARRKKPFPTCSEIVGDAVPLPLDGKVEYDERSHIAHQIGADMDFEEISANLRKLTGKEDIFKGVLVPDRYTEKHRNIVRAFLRRTLREYGYQPSSEKLAGRTKVENILAEIKGTEFPDQVVEISAHFDTTGKDRPGADDNGTGIVLTLEIARLMALNPPKRTVRFVFADLEERGFQGSQLHIQRLKEKKKQLYGALVIDMIGYYPDWHEDSKFVLEIGGRTQHESDATLERNYYIANQFLYQFNRYGERGLSIRPDLSQAMPGTGDHGPYWHGGYPALFVAAPYEHDVVNPNYHGYDDTMDTMNWDYFLAVARPTIEASFYIGGVAEFSFETTDSHHPLRTEVLPGSNFLPEEKQVAKKNSWSSNTDAIAFRDSRLKRVEDADGPMTLLITEGKAVVLFKSGLSVTDLTFFDEDSIAELAALVEKKNGKIEDWGKLQVAEWLQVKDDAVAELREEDNTSSPVKTTVPQATTTPIQETLPATLDTQPKEKGKPVLLPSSKRIIGLIDAHEGNALSIVTVGTKAYIDLEVPERAGKPGLTLLDETAVNLAVSLVKVKGGIHVDCTGKSTSEQIAIHGEIRERLILRISNQKAAREEKEAEKKRSFWDWLSWN